MYVQNRLTDMENKLVITKWGNNKGRGKWEVKD